MLIVAFARLVGSKRRTWSRVLQTLAIVAALGLGLTIPSLATNFGSTANNFVDGIENQISLQNNAVTTVNFYLPDPAQQGLMDLVDNFHVMWDDNGSTHPSGDYPDLDNYAEHFVLGAVTVDNNPPRNHFSSQDVMFADGDYNSPFLGWVDCDESEASENGTDPNRSCLGSIIRMDYSSGWWISNGRYRVILCHELGHASGLRHPTGGAGGNRDSCMDTPASTWRRWLTQHDHDHLDDEYN